jgi:hypothetical protein
MTGRVVVASVEVLLSESFTLSVLEQVVSDFATREELGWDLFAVGSAVGIQLVGPYRMGIHNLSARVSELLLELAGLGPGTMRFSQKVGA